MFSGLTLTSSQHRGTIQMRNPSAPQQTGVPVPEDGVPRRRNGPQNQTLGPIAAMVVCHKKYGSRNANGRSSIFPYHIDSFEARRLHKMDKPS